MGFSKSSAKREVHSHTSLPQETREASNKQPGFTPKATKKKNRRTPKLVKKKKKQTKTCSEEGRMRGTGFLGQ